MVGNEMNVVAEDLQKIVEDFVIRINTISSMEFSTKPLPHKWSKKEVLGHLIDSAHNNLRRFICGQYESTPPNIVYDQDFWVAANGYQNTDKEHIIQLWRFMNLRICSVLTNMPKANYSKECNTGKNKIELHPLKWLAEDYVKHLKHHLNQIFPEAFNVIYP